MYGVICDRGCVYDMTLHHAMQKGGGDDERGGLQGIER